MIPFLKLVSRCLRPRAYAAFTLVELIITTVMIAILSVSVALSTQNIRTQTQFNDYETQIVGIVQQARNLSISNIISEGEQVDYYELALTSEQISLEGVSVSGRVEIDRLLLDSDFAFDLPSDPLFIYYFPPFGDICFSVDCDDGSLTEQSFHLIDLKDGIDLSTEFLINVYGGFPEIVE